MKELRTKPPSFISGIPQIGSGISGITRATGSLIAWHHRYHRSKLISTYLAAQNTVEIFLRSLLWRSNRCIRVNLRILDLESKQTFRIILYPTSQFQANYHHKTKRKAGTYPTCDQRVAKRSTRMYVSLLAVAILFIHIFQFDFGCTSYVLIIFVTFRDDKHRVGLHLPLWACD
jgi:hypothetical protein